MTTMGESASAEGSVVAAIDAPLGDTPGGILVPIRARSPKTGQPVGWHTVAELQLTLMNTLLHVRPDWSAERIALGVSTLMDLLRDNTLPDSPGDHEVGFKR